MNSEPRLTVELVPKTAWGKNLRSELTAVQWKKLRESCYTKADHKCEICQGHGKKHSVEAHEIWQYEDETHIQTLEGLIALCSACHEVKHLGRAFAVGAGGRAIAHLMAVNSWDEGETRTYVQAVFAQWQGRSQHTWQLNLDWLKRQV